MHGVTTTAPTMHRIGRTGGIVLYGHGRGVPEGALQPAARAPMLRPRGKAAIR